VPQKLSTEQKKYISGGKWCIPCLSKWTLFCRTPSAITTPLKGIHGWKIYNCVVIKHKIKTTRSLDQLDINRKSNNVFLTCTKEMPIPQYKNKCICNVSNHFPEYKKKSKQTWNSDQKCRYVFTYHKNKNIFFRIYIQAHGHNLH